MHDKAREQFDEQAANVLLNCFIVIACLAAGWGIGVILAHLM